MDELKQRVRITHPFHPLYGQQFDLLAYRRSWGNVEAVDLQDDHGGVLAIPLAWTDACESDAFVVIAAGRSFFRVEDLVRLVELVEELSRANRRDESG